MATVTMTIEEYEALMTLIRDVRESEGASLADREEMNNQDKPKKRKRSKYQRELGRQLKLLKQKHPRTQITRLMKRAHRATKKALK